MQSPPDKVTFGALPRTATCYGDGTFPVYPSRFPLLPRDQWKPVNINRHVPMIFSQLDGMCTSNGACMAMMVERALRGRPEIILSPEHLYGQHSRWGTGSTLDENLRALQLTGVLTREQHPEWEASKPDNWEELAGANRMLEWVDLNADFDAVATALQLRKPCLVGVNWPGGGGHAVCATELWQNGRSWGIAGPNSWGNWGERMNAEIEYGKFSLTERQCRDFGTFGCWAAGSSTDG